MGGVCLCYPWTGRPVWPLVVALATVPCMLLCSESPAAVVGKMYPRGNHWAVGHLMGKKSIESLQETNSDHITPSETTVATELDRHEPLMAALLQKKTPKQMTPQTGDKLLRLRSGWREEDRNKYLRKMTDLLLLAARLQGNDSA